MNQIKSKQAGSFPGYLRINHYSENTIRSYAYAIKQFFEIYEAFTADNISDYVQNLRKEKHCNTVNLRINAINRYICFTGADIPALKLSRTSKIVNSDNVITIEEYLRLKEGLISSEDIRLYCLVRILATTGMRISEALDITAADILQGYKDVYSKGNKYRRVYFPVTMENDKVRKFAEEMESTDYFFKNNKGEKLSPAGARYLLRKAAEEFDIPVSHVHPHAFRHRFALNFMEKQKDISMLSNLLGHESIETTRIYLSISSDEQRDIINRVVNW